MELVNVGRERKDEYCLFYIEMLAYEITNKNDSLTQNYSCNKEKAI